MAVAYLNLRMRVAVDMSKVRCGGAPIRRALLERLAPTGLRILSNIVSNDITQDWPRQKIIQANPVTRGKTPHGLFLDEPSTATAAEKM